MARTATEVINSHLRYRKNGDLESDINENIATGINILSTYGIYKGHDGVRASASDLKRLLGNATFEYKQVLVEKDFGFLEWSGRSENKVVNDGADSYVVADGKIIFQSIHYTVTDL